ncbi:MAG: hypothetical protein JWR80_1557 [Bradyrhizobium sp.]|nr:hypothetical protein [Bradyrhizobium sp.]
MSDPRFASYWGDVDTRIDAATKRLAKRHFAFGEALDMVATLGAPSPALARLFQDRGYQSGSAFLPGLTGVDDSEYYETLADRWHLRDLAARWLATTPFTATHAKDGALAEFLVLGTALPQAREIACRTGQPVFLMIAGDGTLTVQQTFS